MEIYFCSGWQYKQIFAIPTETTYLWSLFQYTFPPMCENKLNQNMKVWDCKSRWESLSWGDQQGSGRGLFILLQLFGTKIQQSLRLYFHRTRGRPFATGTTQIRCLASPKTIVNLLWCHHHLLDHRHHHAWLPKIVVAALSVKSLLIIHIFGWFG